MTDWIRRALTRKRVKKGPRGAVLVEEPNEKLVYTVRFVLGMTGCLSAIEVASMAFLHAWNSEVFAAITGLIGTVAGVLIGQSAR
ncbi:MAG: hypothetical protein ABSD73_08220 [Candidatus Bathyarchaeia archaeon]